MLSTFVADLADELCLHLSQGTNIMIAGNGGSSSLSSHFAGDLEAASGWSRSPIMPLLSDSAVTTALSNDRGYELTIAERLRRFESGLLLLLSTSGESQNCLRAAEQAKFSGIRTVALVGSGEGSLLSMVHIPMALGTSDVQIAQETMKILLHLVCDEVRLDGGQ